MFSLLVGLLAVVQFVLISAPMQVFAQRLSPSTPSVMILAIAAAISHLTTSLAAGLESSFEYWTATSVFSFGAIVYVQVFGAVLKSISLRILLDLTRRPGGKIDLDEISMQQIPHIFAERCDILIEMGMVSRAQDRYVPTIAGRRLARRIAWLRRLFGIGDSGLYNFQVPRAGNPQAADRSEI